MRTHLHGGGLRLRRAPKKHNTRKRNPPNDQDPSEMRFTISMKPRTCTTPKSATAGTSTQSVQTDATNETDLKRMSTDFVS